MIEKIIPRNVAQRKMDTQFMVSQLAGLQDPSYRETYSHLIFDFCYLHQKKSLTWYYLLVTWDPGLNGSHQANYHSILWMRR